MAIVAVTGMRIEAKIARRAGIHAIVAAGSPERRAAAIAQAVREGATRLISFGISGGLDPSFASGALLLPEAVSDETGAAYTCDAAWRKSLAIHAQGGTIFGASTIVGGAAAKKSLFEQTHAAAVDLESGFVACAGVPFIAVRAIADPAWLDLPPAALVGLDESGGVGLAAVMRSVIAAPGQFSALVRLMFDTRRALAALARAAPLVHSAAMGRKPA